MIDAKVNGKEDVAAPQPQEMAPVIDIMAALKNSLAALKKPPSAALAAVKEEEESQPKRKRAGGM